MAEPTIQHVLDRLAVQDVMLKALQARISRYERHDSRRRTLRRSLPLVFMTLFVLLTPFSLLAASSFNDLTCGVHDGNIGLIYEAGITKGCLPNVSYCPTANVTREEMASFLARTAGLGTNPPVVHALTAETAGTAMHATTAETATGAATVGGYAPGNLVRVARGGSAPGIPLVGAGTYVTLASATLDIPGAGFVLVTGAASLFSTSSSCGCDVSVRLRDIGPGGQVSQSLSAYVGVAFNAQRSESVTPTWVFPIATSGPRTYVLEAAGASGTTSYVGQMVTALYLPFGSTGTAAP